MLRAKFSRVWISLVLQYYVFRICYFAGKASRHSTTRSAIGAVLNMVLRQVTAKLTIKTTGSPGEEK